MILHLLSSGMTVRDGLGRLCVTIEKSWRWSRASCSSRRPCRSTTSALIRLTTSPCSTTANRVLELVSLLLLLLLLHLHAWAARAAPPPSDSFVNGGCNSSTGVIQSRARASGLRVLDSGESGSLWGRYSLSGQVHAFRTPSDSFLKVWVASRSL